MRHPLIALFLLMLPASAIAEPQYFRVTGVAADDTLNVRAEPAASSADIGDLAYNARAIEVAGTDASGKWGRIVWHEGNGWISMRFLMPEEQTKVQNSPLPNGLVCAGTEPFWSATLGTSQAVMGTGETLFYNNTQISAAGRGDFPVHLQMKDGHLESHMLIRPANCSDGMSDRIYPWGVDFLSATSGETIYQVGCCYLPLQ